MTGKLSGESALAHADRLLQRLVRSKQGGSLWRTLALWVCVLVLAGPPAMVLFYRVVEAPATILMVQRAFKGVKVRHKTEPLNDISPHLVRAVIAAEDSRFCLHDGFDVQAIKKAMKYNQRAEKRGSSKRRGASTISQQTAKNLFLWPQRSWVRKGGEVYFTFLMEKLWPKRRIMEAYLNAAEFGHGAFGAEAAARFYFNKSAADLSKREAAMLAAILPSPNKWSAKNPGPYVRRRIGTIVKRMDIVARDGLAGCALPKRQGAPSTPPRPAKEPPRDWPELEAPPPQLAPEETLLLEGLPAPEELAPLEQMPGSEQPAEAEAAAPPPPSEPSPPPEPLDQPMDLRGPVELIPAQ